MGVNIPPKLNAPPPPRPGTAYDRATLLSARRSVSPKQSTPEPTSRGDYGHYGQRGGFDPGYLVPFEDMRAQLAARRDPLEPYRVRLRPERKEEVEKARQIRATATELRARVSQGSYGQEELEIFWMLAENAGVALAAPNRELSTRAGLGHSFFMSVTRDRRRPKLANFLRALTAIVDIADERLLEAEVATGVNSSERVVPSSLVIEKDWAGILPLARSLEQMARVEIERLDAARPNDPERVESDRRQRDLLTILADGFARIAAALEAVANDPHQPPLLGKASEVVREVGEQITAWWKKNAAEAVHWAIRIPVVVASIPLLAWGGANMTVGTTIIGALVGGQKVAAALARRKPKRKE